MKKSLLFGLFFALLLNMQSFGTVTFIMNHYYAQTGTQITIPVKVTGFADILSIQGTIHFDSTKLSYVSFQNFGLSGLDTATGFGTTQKLNGILTFSWIDGTLNGVTVPDSTTIFSITFNVIGTAGVTTPITFVNTPTPFEVLDPSMPTPLEIPFTWANGSVSIYTTTSIHEFQSKGFQLQQNMPNPFSNETSMVFYLPEEGNVSLEIYDVLGNKVAAYNEFMQAGNRSYHLNANRLQSGTYFYRLSSGKYSDVRKMLLVK